MDQSFSVFTVLCVKCVGNVAVPSMDTCFQEMCIPSRAPLAVCTHIQPVHVIGGSQCENICVYRSRKVHISLMS